MLIQSNIRKSFVCTTDWLLIHRLKIVCEACLLVWAHLHRTKSASILSSPSVFGFIKVLVCAQLTVCCLYFAIVAVSSLHVNCNCRPLRNLIYIWRAFREDVSDRRNYADDFWFRNCPENETKDKQAKDRWSWRCRRADEIINKKQQNDSTVDKRLLQVGRSRTQNIKFPHLVRYIWCCGILWARTSKRTNERANRIMNDLIAEEHAWRQRHEKLNVLVHACYTTATKRRVQKPKWKNTTKTEHL